MNELIQLHKVELEGYEVNAVNARDLYDFLESKQKFADWIKTRLEETQAVENADFQVFQDFMKNPQGGRPRVEYILSLDLAKEFAMLERNTKGKEARRYFIEVEKSYRQASPTSSLEALQATINHLVEQERATKALEAKTHELEQEQRKIRNNFNRLLNNDNYMTVIAYANLIGKRSNEYHAPTIGKRAKRLSEEQGAPMGAVIDPRFGRINTYSIDILRQLFG